MAKKYRFHLRPNRVGPNPSGCVARVKPYATLYLKDILERVQLRGSLVTPTDALAVISLTFDVISDEVANGNAVMLSLLNLRPGIKGKFRDLQDTFDPARHKTRVSLRAGNLLKRKLAGVTAVKTAPVPEPAPLLLEYRDIASQVVNQILLPGGIGQIRGERLKFNPANNAEGIFFTDSAGNAIRVSVVAYRTEKRLLFEVPAMLPPDTYTVEVRRAYGKAAATRTGHLEKPLTVV